jgi:hypothetical protein
MKKNNNKNNFVIDLLENITTTVRRVGYKFIHRMIPFIELPGKNFQLSHHLLIKQK